MEKKRRREFRRESFGCVRDWVHFCVEFDLRICSGCRRRSRIGIGAPETWLCASCARTPHRDPLPLHPDLWRALTSGRATEANCPICRETVPLRECWISDDGRRLYCARHLRPIAVDDRFRRAVREIDRTDGVLREKPSPSSVNGCESSGLRGPRLREGALVRAQLAGHLLGGRCTSCPHNGQAIYQDGRLLEIDGDRRRCTSNPDTLNCAGIDH